MLPSRERELEQGVSGDMVGSEPGLFEDMVGSGVLLNSELGEPQGIFLSVKFERV